MNPTLDALRTREVPPMTVAALTLTTVALVLADPLLGRRQHRDLLTAVRADPAGAERTRLTHYRSWIGQSWLWALGVVVLVAALPGVGPASLGLRAPDLAGIGASVWHETDAATQAGTGDTIATVAGMLVGALLGTLVAVGVWRLVARLRRTDTVPLAGSAALTPMLPTTRAGRRGWAALSVTAGITEEVTYRGLVILTLATLLPTADPRVVVVLAAVLFGAAHLYQGWTGMLATGVAGAALAGLYLGTGSLVVPMALHVLIDLRVLLLARRSPVRDAPAVAGARSTGSAVPA